MNTAAALSPSPAARLIGEPDVDLVAEIANAIEAAPANILRLTPVALSRRAGINRPRVHVVFGLRSALITAAECELLALIVRLGEAFANCHAVAARIHAAAVAAETGQGVRVYPLETTR